MDKYRCGVCGYIYDEEKEGKPFTGLLVCPICKQAVTVFEKADNGKREEVSETLEASESDLEYPSDLARKDSPYRICRKSTRWLSVVSQ